MTSQSLWPMSSPYELKLSTDLSKELVLDYTKEIELFCQERR